MNSSHAQPSGVGGLCLTLLISLGLSPEATAETVVLTPQNDNMIYEEFPEFTCGSGSHIIAGEIKDGYYRRALLRFDVSGIPDGATIDSVSLGLNLNRTQDNQSSPMSLHRLTRDWGEGTANCDSDPGKGAEAAPGDATWPDAKYQQVAWTNAGGDFVGASATSSVGTSNNTVYTWSGGGLVTDVQA